MRRRRRYDAGSLWWRGGDTDCGSGSPGDDRPGSGGDDCASGNLSASGDDCASGNLSASGDDCASSDRASSSNCARRRRRREFADDLVRVAALPGARPSW